MRRSNCLVRLLGLTCTFLLLTSTLTRPAPHVPITYGPWRSCKIGGGGYIQNVVVCPSNPRRLYCYVDVGGAFRSDDGGQSWRMLHGNLHPAGVKARQSNYEVRGLIVDPRDDRKVILATGSQWADEGIYVSADAGESWRKTLTASYWGNGPHRWSGFVLTRNPAHPDSVVTAGVETGVWRSADNGLTWQQGGAQGLFPTDIRFDRTNPQRLWLCAATQSGWHSGQLHKWSGGFFRSEDGGVTWQKLADDGPYETLQDPLDANRLYGTWKETEIRLSTDGGVTWQPFSQGLPIQPEDPGGANSGHHFNALAAGPNFVLAASANGTFYRLDAGATHWLRIERQGVEEIYEGQEWFRHKTGGMGWALGSITIDPRDANHWFFTDWFAIYQTFDAGRHWKLTIDGIEVTVLHAIVQDPADPGVVHLGMADNGYFYSTDGGERFQHVGEGISNNIKCIALSPKLESRIYAVGPRTWEWEANQVFVSIDRGLHWVRSPMEGLPDMAQHKCNTIAVDPEHPYTVYLAVSGKAAPGDGGLYRSTDGGRKWSWYGDGLPAGAALYRESIWGHGPEIAVDRAGNLLTISTLTGQVYRRAAGAATWVKVEVPALGQPSEVVTSARRPGHFYLATSAGLWLSEASGATWHRAYQGNVAHVAVDGRDVPNDDFAPERLAIGTDDGVVLSNDDGKTWTPLDKRLPYRVNNIVAFAGDRLLAGTGGNGAFWMPLTRGAERPVQAGPRSEQHGQVFGRITVGLQLAAGDLVEPLMAGPGGAGQWLVRAVADIEKADVVVLAVEAAQRRLVVEREVMHAHTPWLCGGILGVHAEGLATGGLVAHVADAAGR